VDESAGKQQIRPALSGQERPTAAEKLRELIAQHRNSFAVQASGLGSVLGVLDAYVLATEARIANLERAMHERRKLGELV